MKKLQTRRNSRLRLYAFLEGASLLMLLFLAMPLKYFLNEPAMVKWMGPIHGALFLVFLLNAMQAAIAENWPRRTVAMLILACFIPFGTFYINRIVTRNNSQMNRG